MRHYRNVSLQHNLVCPSTDGLVVGSANTTIHMNGHSITCPDEAFGCFQSDDSGIYSDQNNTVVVGPGTISGFYSQISLDGSNASTVTGVTTNGGREGWGRRGVNVSGTSDLVKNVADTADNVSFYAGGPGTSNSFVNDKSTGAGTGFYIADDSMDMLSGDTATHSVFEGFYIYFADHTTVKNSKADHVVTPPYFGAGFVDICSTYGTYSGNTSNANLYDGFDFFHSDCGAPAPPHASFPFDHTNGMQVVFTGNLAKGNGGDGAYFDKADAAEGSSGAGSTISGNAFLGNGGDGMDMYRTYVSHVFHNTANGNGVDGYDFNRPAADMINGNIGNGNGEDGITIYWDDTCEVVGPFFGCDPQWVSYNTFTHNFDFGAYADDLVSSTGNVANHNGTSPNDCVNVNCQAHAALSATPALAASKGAATDRGEKTLPSLPKLPAAPAKH